MFFIFLLFLNIMKIYCYIKNPYILKRFYNLECTHLENYVKNILILDNDMPTLYTNIDVSNNNLKKKLYLEISFKLRLKLFLLKEVWQNVKGLVMLKKILLVVLILL